MLGRPDDLPRGTSFGDPPTDPFPPVAAPAPAGAHVRLFGSRAYFRLWLAQVVSSLGDWIGFVAVVAVAQRLGGKSPEAAISLVMAARLVPGLFLSQLAGVIVDRLDRKQVMVACDVGRGVVLATVPFLGSIWALVVASFLLEVGTLLWSPAKEASVPNLVPTDRLTTANSMSLVAAYGTFPVAAITFAALAKVADSVGVTSESVAIGFDVVTFLVSAAVISTLPLVARRATLGVSTPERRPFWTELREGWAYIAANPVVRAVMVGVGTGLIGGGMVVPLGPVYATQVLAGGAASYGLLLTSLGCGVAAGVCLLSPVQRRLAKEVVFCQAVLLAGLSLIAATLTTSSAVTMACIFALGVCAGAVYVLGFTILHEAVDDDLRGRTFSTLYTLVRFCLLLAFAIGPLLARVLDDASQRWLGGRVGLGIDVELPGVRLTLFLAGVIVVAAGGLARRTLAEGRA